MNKRLFLNILRWCKDSDGISGTVESTPDLKSVGVGLNPTRSSDLVPFCSHDYPNQPVILC